MKKHLTNTQAYTAFQAQKFLNNIGAAASVDFCDGHRVDFQPHSQIVAIYENGYFVEKYEKCSQFQAAYNIAY